MIRGVFCIISLLLLTAAHDYKFKDAVFVKSGFYQGCFGEVRDIARWRAEHFKILLHCDSEKIGVKIIHKANIEPSARKK